MTGRDLSEKLPLHVKFSDQTLTWQEVTAVSMITVDELDTQNENEIVEQLCEHGHASEVIRRTVQILHASHEKADSSAIIMSKCTHLLKEERAALLELLLRCKHLFDGTLGMVLRHVQK
jgi:hypothetical protein